MGIGHRAGLGSVPTRLSPRGSPVWRRQTGNGEILERIHRAYGDERYSPAMRAHGEAGVVWTPEDLQAFLADPRGVVPGTGMAFQLKGETERVDVIAYLQTLKP